MWHTVIMNHAKRWTIQIFFRIDNVNERQDDKKRLYMIVWMTRIYFFHLYSNNIYEKTVGCLLYQKSKQEYFEFRNVLMYSIETRWTLIMLTTIWWIIFSFIVRLIPVCTIRWNYDEITMKLRITLFVDLIYHKCPSYSYCVYEKLSWLL